MSGTEAGRADKIDNFENERKPVGYMSPGQRCLPVMV